MARKTKIVGQLKTAYYWSNDKTKIFTTQRDAVSYARKKGAKIIKR